MMLLVTLSILALMLLVSRKQLFCDRTVTKTEDLPITCNDRTVTKTEDLPITCNDRTVTKTEDLPITCNDQSWADRMYQEFKSLPTRSDFLPRKPDVEIPYNTKIQLWKLTYEGHTEDSPVMKAARKEHEIALHHEKEWHNLCDAAQKRADDCETEWINRWQPRVHRAFLSSEAFPFNGFLCDLLSLMRKLDNRLRPTEFGHHQFMITAESVSHPTGKWDVRAFFTDGSAGGTVFLSEHSTETEAMAAASRASWQPFQATAWRAEPVMVPRIPTAEELGIN